MCDELIAAPIHHPPVLLGEGNREFVTKVEAGKKEGLWGGVFKMYFYFL